MTGLRPQKANGFECVDDDSTPSKERAICVGSIIILLALLFCMFGVHVVEGDIPRETTGMRPRHGPIAPVSPPKRGRGTDIGHGTTEDLQTSRANDTIESSHRGDRPPSPLPPRLRVPRSSPPSAVVGRAAGTWWRRHGLACTACGFRTVVFAGPVRAVERDAHPRRGAAFGAIGCAAHIAVQPRSRLAFTARAVARGFVVSSGLNSYPYMRSEWCRRWCASRPAPAGHVSSGRALRDADVDLGLPVRHIGKPKLHTGDRD